MTGSRSADGDSTRPTLSRRSRQGSIMVTSVDIPALLEKHVSLKLENLHDAHPITPDQLKELIKKLTAIEHNLDRLALLQTEKVPYIFSSADLLKIVYITESVKTRLKFIQDIAPRLNDPRSKMQELKDLFRFSEEKAMVEDALKQRANAMSNSMFSTGAANPSLMTGGRAGRGGRGPGLRTPGGSRDSVGSPSSTEPEAIKEEEEEVGSEDGS